MRCDECGKSDRLKVNGEPRVFISLRAMTAYEKQVCQECLIRLVDEYESSVAETAQTLKDLTSLGRRVAGRNDRLAKENIELRQKIRQLENNQFFTDLKSQSQLKSMETKLESQEFINEQLEEIINEKRPKKQGRHSQKQRIRQRSLPKVSKKGL